MSLKYWPGIQFFKTKLYIDKIDSVFCLKLTFWDVFSLVSVCFNLVFLPVVV